MDQGAMRETLRPVQEALLGVQDSQRSMQELLITRMALSTTGGPASAEAPLATGWLPPRHADTPNHSSSIQP